jgi:hypothetical protein
MTDASWSTRWRPLIERYPAQASYDFDVEDGRAISRLVSNQAKKGLDLESLISEYSVLVQTVFPDDTVLIPLVQQAAYKGLTIPQLIATCVPAYPDFPWTHLFTTNAIMANEIQLFETFVSCITGDVYAGLKFPGITNSIKNLGYLCVKLHTEIGGDEQFKKYRGIGGVGNQSSIPLKPILDAMISEYKKKVVDLKITFPTDDRNAFLQQKFSKSLGITRTRFTDFLSVTPAIADADDVDAPIPTFKLFSEGQSSDDDDDGFDHPTGGASHGHSRKDQKRKRHVRHESPDSNDSKRYRSVPGSSRMEQPISSKTSHPVIFDPSLFPLHDISEEREIMNSFISQIGNVTDKMGKETELEVPTLPVSQAQRYGGYHAPTIDRESHNLFEEIPSLGIAGDMVMAVASAADEPEPNFHVQRPPGAIFTENLCGRFYPIGPRRAEIRQRLASQGITSTEFPEYVAGTRFNLKYMLSISDQMNRVMTYLLSHTMRVA